jgi:hypothetical protein
MRDSSSMRAPGDAIRDRLRDERGVALLMALGILLVLSLGFATSIALTSSGSRHAQRSKADQKSYALAEDGVNNAVSVIFSPANKLAAKSVDCSNPATYSTGTPAYKDLLTPRTTTRLEGSVTWSGVFFCTADPTDPTFPPPFWKVTSVAIVTNPTGPGTAAVRRVVTVKVPLDQTADTVTTTLPGGLVTTTYTTWNTQTQVTTGAVTSTYATTTTSWDGSPFGSSFLYSKGDVVLSGNTPVEMAIIGEGNLTFNGSGTGLDAAASAVSMRGTIALAPGWIGDGTAPPPTLTRAMSTTSTVINVTSTTGFSHNLVRIPNSSGTGFEYIQYTAASSDTTLCQGAPPCFTGLTRGYVPGYPAFAHSVGAIVDGRLVEVHTRGGCGGTCGQIKAQVLESGAGASLIQDSPTWQANKPVFDVVAARAGAAPGPNHQPSPSCAISFATAAGNPYYTGATIDLTPTSNYTCTASGGAYGTGTGELSWNNTTKVLKVRGVVFIPANVNFSQSVLYDAPWPGATMYIAGTFAVGSGVSICGKAACAQTWNPTIDSLLGLVMVDLPGVNPSHDIAITAAGTRLQLLLYTDGVFKFRSTGFSGTAFAGSIDWAGGAQAPAPGIFSMTPGFGAGHTVVTTATTVVTTGYTTTSTTPFVGTTVTTSSIPVTTTTATTVRSPTTPRNFGG